MPDITTSPASHLLPAWTCPRSDAAVEPLIVALGDSPHRTDEEVVAIAGALERLRDARAIAPLVERSLHVETDAVEGAIRRAIASFGDQAVSVLQERLMASEGIYEISGVLARIGNERAVNALIQYLEYLDTEEGATSYEKSNMGQPELGREKVVRALGEVSTPVATAAIAGALATTTSLLTRRLAVDILRNRGWRPSNGREALRYALALIEVEHSENTAWNYWYPTDDPCGAPPLPESVKVILDEWHAEAAGELASLVSEIAEEIAAAANRFRAPRLYGEDRAKLLWAFAKDLDEPAIDVLAEFSGSSEARTAFYATCALISVDGDRVVRILEEIAARPREVTLLDHDESAFQQVGEKGGENEGQRQIASAELQRRRSQT